jgi:hypothetical protein
MTDAEIEGACAELLDGISTRPTDLRLVGARLNVAAIRERPELPFAGLLDARPDGTLEVGHAPAPAPAFTIAHELGHAYLRAAGRTVDQEERFCDRFAAALLMPAELMHEDLAGALTIQRLRSLARMYEVSISAITVRAASFTTLGAVAADRRGMLWRVGTIKSWDAFVAESVAEVLDSPDPLRRRVWRRTTHGLTPWILEGERLRRSMSAFLLVTPTL